MKIKIPQLLWYDNTEMELDFPSSWSVFFCPMKGGERKKLTHKEMEKAFHKPIGSKPIQELAKGKKEESFSLMIWRDPLPFLKSFPLSSGN